MSNTMSLSNNELKYFMGAIGCKRFSYNERVENFVPILQVKVPEPYIPIVIEFLKLRLPVVFGFEVLPD